jgi:hypothetical protein
MDIQLALLETPTDWKLDDRTRETGRQGLAEARAALRQAARAQVARAAA